MLEQPSFYHWILLPLSFDRVKKYNVSALLKRHRSHFWL
jgi:hypothetical protein